MTIYKQIRTAQLKEHPQNKKYFGSMNKEEWAGFLEDIRAVGITTPLTVNKQGYVVKGNMRLRAAKELDIKTVPCFVVEYDTDEAELMDLIRDNVMRREPDIFTKMKLVEELKKRYPKKSPPGVKIETVQNEQELPPRDLIKNFLNENVHFMAMANLFNALPKDKQQELKDWFYSQEKGPTKKELDEKIRELGDEKDKADKEIKNLLPYKKAVTDLEKLKEKIAELETKESELFKDAEGVQQILDALVAGRDFFTKQCMVIPALKITTKSKELMHDDIEALVELVENWLAAIKQKLL